MSNPFSSTDGLIVRKSITPFTGETIYFQSVAKQISYRADLFPFSHGITRRDSSIHTPVLFV